MRHLGMRLLENPHRDPPWLQVVGVLDAPARDAAEGVVNLGSRSAHRGASPHGRR
jgi:hypothetical protein